METGFLGTRQVLLVGLGGVGGRIVNTIMRDMPESRKPYTQAIAIDTDINDMDALEFVPRDNKIVLASSPGSGNAMTIGKYMQKNPGASEWFVTEGAAFKTLMGQSTKQGAKQIRMVSRLALSATAKYYNLENRITRIISKLSSSDGSINRDTLLVMVVCSVSGGTGAGTVLQVPMYLEEIITKYFDPSAVSMQCAMLLPNLFNQTQANGNYFKGQVNGYAVMRELQSLNKGNLRRFEYMRDYLEVNGEDSRNKAPYSFVLLFDNATSSGAAINGSTDGKHIPNIASCLSEYIYGPASHKCTSQLDNTLDAVYSSGGTAIYRAVGRSSLVYPDHIYKQYAVSQWILSSVSENWLLPDDEASKARIENARKRKEEGKRALTELEKHNIYADIVRNEAVCKGSFFEEIRAQLVAESGEDSQSERRLKAEGPESDNNLARVFYNAIETMFTDEKLDENPDYAREFENLKTQLISKVKNDGKTYLKIQAAYNEFFSTIGSLVSSIMCPNDSLTNRFLVKYKNDKCFYPFIRERGLHPIALRCFLYDLEEILHRNKEMSISEYTGEEVNKKLEKVQKRKLPGAVKTQLETLAKPYKDKVIKELCTKMYEYVTDLIIEIESFFEDLKRIKVKFEGIACSCGRSIDEYENELVSLVGSKESMYACWNDVRATIREDSDESEDVVDKEISVEIDKIIYTNFYKWVNSEYSIRKSDSDDVFRPKTDYAKLVSDHLLVTFNKRINEQHAKSFPENILKAAIHDAYASVAYEERERLDPKFKPENFEYSVGESEIAYEVDSTIAADYLNARLVATVKKAEPLSGPLYAKEANQDYFSRLLYFNEDILAKTTVIDDNVESGAREQIITNEFFNGVSTTDIGTFNVQNEPVQGISKHQISCFSYTGGLELSDFINMQDPVSGTYDPTDGHCYYNAYRDHINRVMNTTTDNITPHLHKDWHLAGMLDDITDDHTDSVNANAAKAFLYGFLFNDIIRVVDYGYVMIGDKGNPIFTDMPGAIDGIIEFRPLSNVEHARFRADITETNKILYEIFQYLRVMPELRTRIIKYGDDLIAKAKESKSGSVFKSSLAPEVCAHTNVYSTIIDVLDGFYQHARFTELHDVMKNDIKTLGEMFGTLCDVTIDVCASIYAAPNDRINAYGRFVDRLFDDAACDDDVINAGVTAESSMDDLLDGTDEKIDMAKTGASKPFALGGMFDMNAMKSKMEAYLNKN